MNSNGISVVEEGLPSSSGQGVEEGERIVRIRLKASNIKDRLVQRAVNLPRTLILTRELAVLLMHLSKSKRDLLQILAAFLYDYYRAVFFFDSEHLTQTNFLV